MLVRLLVKVDMFSVFPCYGLAKKKTILFDIKRHDSYLKANIVPHQGRNEHLVAR